MTRAGVQSTLARSARLTPEVRPPPLPCWGSRLLTHPSAAAVPRCCCCCSLHPTAAPAGPIIRGPSIAAAGSLGVLRRCCETFPSPLLLPADASQRIAWWWWWWCCCCCHPAALPGCSAASVSVVWRTVRPLDLRYMRRRRRLLVALTVRDVVAAMDEGWFVRRYYCCEPRIYF